MILSRANLYTGRPAIGPPERTYGETKCDWCGKAFTKNDRKQRFCSPWHRVAWQSRKKGAK
jgi:hypothetical protein